MIDDLKINDELKGALVRQGYWTHDTIADIWQRARPSRTRPQYVCDDTGNRLTYGEVDDKSGRIAAWLIAEGHGPAMWSRCNFPPGPSSASPMWPY